MNTRSFISRFALLAGLAACGSTVHSIVPPDNTSAAQATMWQQVKDIPKVDYYGISGFIDSAKPDPITKLPTVTIFAVGDGGTIIKSDGIKFTVDKSNTTNNLHAVHIVSSTLAYAAGVNGTIVQWDGTNWTLQDTGSKAQFDDIWADAKEVFAVGPSGTAYTFQAGAWIPVPTQTQDSLYGVTKVGGNIVAVGSLGTVAQYNANQQLEVTPDPTCTNGSAGDATATSNAPCNGCVSGACNISGQACTSNASCNMTPFSCVANVIQSPPYTVTVLVGGVPTTITTTTTETNNQCMSSQSFTRTVIGNGYTDTLSRLENSPAGVYAGGVGGKIFKYNGSGFSQVKPSASSPTLPDVFIRDVAGPGNGDLYVVGWSGLLARLRNNTFLIYNPPPSPPAAGEISTPPAWFSQIWCQDPQHIFIVGASGSFIAGAPPMDPTPASAGTTGGGS